MTTIGGVSTGKEEGIDFHGLSVITNQGSVNRSGWLMGRQLTTVDNVTAMLLKIDIYHKISRKKLEALAQKHKVELNKVDVNELGDKLAETIVDLSVSVAGEGNQNAMTIPKIYSRVLNLIQPQNPQNQGGTVIK